MTVQDRVHYHHHQTDTTPPPVITSITSRQQQKQRHQQQQQRQQIGNNNDKENYNGDEQTKQHQIALRLRGYQIVKLLLNHPHHHPHHPHKLIGPQDVVLRVYPFVRYFLQSYQPRWNTTQENGSSTTSGREITTRIGRYYRIDSIDNVIEAKVHLRHRPGGQIDYGVISGGRYRRLITNGDGTDDGGGVDGGARECARIVNCHRPPSSMNSSSSTTGSTNSSSMEEMVSSIRRQWLAPPQMRTYDKDLVDAFARGQSSYTKTIRCGTAASTTTTTGEDATTRDEAYDSNDNDDDDDGDEWTIRITKSRLMGKGTVDARDPTHIGWKRDLNLTLFAGQELPEVMFGDSSLEIRLQTNRRQGGGDDDGDDDDDGGKGVRLSFCALDALRCWALLDHPPPPHLAELRNQRDSEKEERRTNDRTNDAAIDKEIGITTNDHEQQQQPTQTGQHGWDYTFTTTYPGATDTLPLGTNLPKHPGPNQRCDSLHPRPAVDLVQAQTNSCGITSTSGDGNGGGGDGGKLQLRKALCKCIDSRVLVLNNNTSTDTNASKLGGGGGVLNASAVDPAAAAMGIWIPPTTPSAAAPLNTSDSNNITKATTNPKPPPCWKSINPTTTTATATDIFNLLQDIYTTSPTTILPPPHLETVDLWLDNLDPHSLSFLRLSTVLVPAKLWAVQLRCFVRVNGVMARVVDTKLVCRFEEGRCVDNAGRVGDRSDNDDGGGGRKGVWVIHRERSWREGDWAQFVGLPSPPPSTTTTTKNSDEEGQQQQSSSSILQPLSKFGGYEDRVAYQRLPLTRPAEYDELILPRITEDDLIDGVDGDDVGVVPEMLWRRKLRCQCLDTTSGATSSMAVLVDNDGLRVEAINALMMMENDGDIKCVDSDTTTKHAHTLWSRVAPDDTAILTIALSPTKTTTIPHRHHLQKQLLALGTERGTILLWDATTGQSMASFPISIPQPALKTSTIIHTRNNNNRRHRLASGWVEILCWNEDGFRIAGAAGRTAVVASIVEEKRSVVSANDNNTTTATIKGGDDCESNKMEVGVTVEVVLGEESSRTHSIGTVSGSVSALSQVVKVRRRPVSGNGDDFATRNTANEVEEERFAIGGYGGVRWLTAVGTTTTTVEEPNNCYIHCIDDVGCKDSSNNDDDTPPQQQSVVAASPLIIGATATLAVAASPEGTQIAVGCLDKRMRVFSTIDGLDNSKSNHISHPNNHCTSTSTSMTAYDWVGFDGPVNLLTWSSHGNYLAAVGGTALLVLPRSRIKSDPPIRCVLPTTPVNTATTGGISTSGIGAIAWIPASSSFSKQEEGILAAIEANSGHVHIFSVSPERLDGGVPQRASPIWSIASPGVDSGESSLLVQLAFVVGVEMETGEGKIDNGDGGSEGVGLGTSRVLLQKVGIIVGHGDWTGAYTIPLKILL